MHTRDTYGMYIVCTGEQVIEEGSSSNMEQDTSIGDVYVCGHVARYFIY